jgi:hypothetical protein
MASPIQYNIDLANRQIEVNEWAYNNKTDTLFFFQLLFISLMFVTVLMCMQATDQVGGDFVHYSIGVLTLINIVIIINRSVYTSTKRDTRAWNRKRFNGDNNTDSPILRGDKNYLAYIDSVRAKYSPPAAAAAGTVGAAKCVCPNTGVKCC